jgi:hypothetical protein
MLNAPTPSRGGLSKAKTSQNEEDVSDADIQAMLAQLKS